MNIFDRIIGVFAPEKEERNLASRMRVRLLRQISNKGYDQHGASVSKKLLRGWRTQSGDADEDIVKNIPKLRERSRDLWMGVPLATGALGTIQTNVVGSGLTPNAMIAADIIGMSEDQKLEWEHRAEILWAYWAGSPKCDIRRMHNFGILQGLAILSVLMNGDAFVLLPMVERQESLFDLRVRLIEADRVENPSQKQQGKDILGGVEVDDDGCPVAYWMANRHPGGSGMGKIEHKRVEAFGKESGRRNVLHLLYPERIEQRRGVPILAPVIEALKQLGRYTEAELVAAVVSGFFTVFVKTPSPSIESLGEAVPISEQVDSADTTTLELGNGSVIGLAPGDEIQTANPSRPNSNFEGFVTAISRQVGAALGLPYEVLIKHFTASYSASRGALLEAWKYFKVRRSWLAGSMCQPVYEEFLAEAIARGHLEAPGFFDDPLVRWAYSRTEWHGPSQGQLNPLDEAKAAKVRVEEGFSTRSRETAELTGGDFEAYNAQRAKEERMRREAGLSVDSKPNSDDGGDQQDRDNDSDDGTGN